MAGWPTRYQQGLRVPTHPNGRVEVTSTRPRPQDGEHLLKQDRKVTALDSYRPLRLPARD
jgi:hypothetical protein